MGQLAELAGCQERAKALHDGMVEVVEAVGDHDAGAEPGVAYLGGLIGVCRERLLRQNVFAGVDGGQVPRPVQCVG
ncbi:MAG TPA: hypothetical protein VI011_25705 [Asanoa sp.]